MIIGIIGAMREETSLVSEMLSGRKLSTVSGVELSVGLYAGHTVIVCTCGIGKSSAAAATQLLIDRYGCGAIINTGIAGNTDSELFLGDVVVGRRLVYHDFDGEILSHAYPFTRDFCSDDKLCEIALAACEALSVRCKAATVATGDVFVSDEAVKADIVARTGCSCVEMEGAAVGHIAKKCGVPFLVLRVMSDDAARESAKGVMDNTIDTGDYCRLSRSLLKIILTEL